MKTCRSCLHFAKRGELSWCENPRIPRTLIGDAAVANDCEGYETANDCTTPTSDPNASEWMIVLRIERTDLGGALSEPSYFAEAKMPLGTGVITSGTVMSGDAEVAAQEAVQNLIDRLDKTPKAL